MSSGRLRVGQLNAQSRQTDGLAASIVRHGDGEGWRQAQAGIDSRVDEGNGQGSNGGENDGDDAMFGKRGKNAVGWRNGILLATGQGGKSKEVWCLECEKLQIG